MQIDIPTHVKHIMQKLIDENFDIYLVGGSVRDYLLGETTTDFDFATSALPDEIKSTYNNYKLMDYGEEHGTVGIYHNGFTYEITTYREEDEYSDGRRPDNVNFVSDLKIDLSRRDFTINALAADINGDIIDYYQGIDDFNKGIIRAVGKPEKRFKEDSLRVLRAVRFSLRLDFVIQVETEKAIEETAYLLVKHAISGERIMTELDEILDYSEKAFSLLDELGIARNIFPKLYQSEGNKDVLHTLKRYPQSINQKQLWGLIIYHSADNNVDRKNCGSKIFAKYPGKGKEYAEEVIGLSTNIDYTLSLLELWNDNRVNRWIRQAKGNLDRYPDFDIDNYLKNLITLTAHEIGVLETENVEKLLEVINNEVEKLMTQLPIDGNYVNSHGIKKRAIGAVLDELRLLKNYGYIHTKDHAIEYFNQLKYDDTINMVTIRENLSGKEPLFTEDENEELRQSVINKIIIKDQIMDRIKIIIGSKLNEEIYDSLSDEYKTKILKITE